MTIKQLEYFSAVAKLLSFSKAAEQLYISQSALSRSIVALENELNIPLFFRDRHSVSLTAAGAVLLSRLPKLSVELTEIIAETQQANTKLLGSMRLGIQNGMVLPDSLYDTLSQLCRAGSELEILPVCMDAEAIYESINEKKIDAVYSCEDLVPEGYYFDRVLLDEQPACIAYNREKFSFENPSDSLADYRNISFMLCGGEGSVSVQRFKSLCLANGFYPKTTLVKDSATQFFCIEIGLGIGVFPAGHKIFEHPKMSRIVLGDVPLFSCELQWPAKAANPAISHFVEAVRKRLPQTFS